MKLRVRYEGQIFQMEINTLVVSLLNFVEMISVVADKAGLGGYLQVRVEAIEKGSFAVILEVAKKALTGLLEGAEEVLSPISSIVNTVINVLTLKKFLRGEKPDKIREEGEKVVVCKGNHQLVVARNVWIIYSKNATINQHMEQIFRELSEDTEIEGVTIESEQTESFQASSRDFVFLARDNEVLEEAKQKQIAKNVPLRILKVVFNKDRKWEFIYQGNKISALIVDQEFWRQVDAGKKFAKGDVLVGDLEILQVFEPEVNCFVNKEFKVVRVGSHRPAPEQRTLF